MSADSEVRDPVCGMRVDPSGPHHEQHADGSYHFYSERRLSRFREEPDRFTGATLAQGDLRGILQARRLSRLTTRNIRQNLFFAFAYNALGIPVAAGILYPWLGLLLSPMIAALQ